jgi:hypothetical protein
VKVIGWGEKRLPTIACKPSGGMELGTLACASLCQPDGLVKWPGKRIRSIIEIWAGRPWPPTGWPHCRMASTKQAFSQLVETLAANEKLFLTWWYLLMLSVAQGKGIDAKIIKPQWNGPSQVWDSRSARLPRHVCRWAPRP